MGLRHLRKIGVLTRASEWTAEMEDHMRFKGNTNDALYPV